MIAIPFLLSLLLVCSQAFVEQTLNVSAPLNFTVKFPQSFQTSKRILVSITISDPGRLHFFGRQLTHYAEACERGFDIHVLLVTMPETDWSPVKEIHSPGLFRCQRLQSDIPIQIFNTPPIPRHLSFYHRPIFSALQNDYDYFISQEDDILITAGNLHYFIHYETRLRGTGLLPTFAIYEIPYTLPISPEMKRKYLQFQHLWPRGWLTSQYKLYLLSYIIRSNHGEYYFVPWKSYPACYMIPQWILQKYSKLPFWLGDELKPWLEFNVEFAHMWLARYFTLVIPISEWFESAFMHHSSNKYINMAVVNEPDMTRNALDGSNHAMALDPEEVQEFLMQAVGISRTPDQNKHLRSVQHQQEQPQVPRHWSLNISYNGKRQDSKLPLKSCVDANHTAQIEPTFLGKFPEAFYTRKIEVSVKFKCISGQIVRQELQACADIDHCCSGYGPEVRHLNPDCTSDRTRKPTLHSLKNLLKYLWKYPPKH